MDLRTDKADEIAYIEAQTNLSKELMDIEVLLQKVRELDVAEYYFFERSDQVLFDALRAIRYRNSEEIAKKTRQLRDKANSVLAHQLMRDINDQFLAVDDLKYKAYRGSDYIEIGIPYLENTKSTLFLVRHNELKNVDSLDAVTYLWKIIMGMVLKKYSSNLPFERPLAKVTIRITTFYNNSRIPDPDHFWYRPVIDSFKENLWLTDDSSANLTVVNKYIYDSKSPEIRIQFGPGEDRVFCLPRNGDLVEVF